MPEQPQHANASTPTKPRKVPCPTCHAPALFSPENPWRPFCRARCQGHDFGAWASEAYRVGTKPPPEDQE